MCCRTACLEIQLPHLYIPVWRLLHNITLLSTLLHRTLQSSLPGNTNSSPLQSSPWAVWCPLLNITLLTLINYYWQNTLLHQSLQESLPGKNTFFICTVLVMGCVVSLLKNSHSITLMRRHNINPFSTGTPFHWIFDVIRPFYWH